MVQGVDDPLSGRPEEFEQRKRAMPPGWDQEILSTSGLGKAFQPSVVGVGGFDARWHTRGGAALVTGFHIIQGRGVDPHDPEELGRRHEDGEFQRRLGGAVGHIQR